MKTTQMAVAQPLGPATNANVPFNVNEKPCFPKPATLSAAPCLALECLTHHCGGLIRRAEAIGAQNGRCNGDS